MKSSLIFGCSATAQETAKKIATELRVKPGKIIITKFSNDNTFVQFKQSVRGKTVYLIQDTIPPVNERIMELLISADAARRAGAQKIIAVLPYFPYSRSDKKDQPRVPITAKLLADMIEIAGIERVITCDIHNSVIQAYFNKTRCDVLSVKTLLADYLSQKKLKNMVVVATDAGSAKAALRYSEYLKCPVAMISKHREGNDDKAVADTIVGDVADKNCLVFDDEIDTAGTITEATRILKENGAKNIYIAATHGVLSGSAVDRLSKSLAEEIIVTDTIPVPKNKQFGKLTTLSVVSVLSKAISQIENHQESDDLFEP